MYSMRLNEKLLQPWVLISQSGVVVSAHCGCMAGLAETCTHVGTLLFKIEAVVRVREKETVTGVPAYWMIPSSVNKVLTEVGFKIDYTSASMMDNHKKCLFVHLQAKRARLLYQQRRKLTACSVTCITLGTKLPFSASCQSIVQNLRTLWSQLQLQNHYKVCATPSVTKWTTNPWWSTVMIYFLN